MCYTEDPFKDLQEPLATTNRTARTKRAEQRVPNCWLNIASRHAKLKQVDVHKHQQSIEASRPEDRHGTLNEAIGEQIELLQETHNA